MFLWGDGDVPDGPEGRTLKGKMFATPASNAPGRKKTRTCSADPLEDLWDRKSNRGTPCTLFRRRKPRRSGMAISGYQIATVIKTYIKNMEIRARSADDGPELEVPADQITISEEGRGLLFDRIRKQMAERLRRKR